MDVAFELKDELFSFLQSERAQPLILASKLVAVWGILRILTRPRRFCVHSPSPCSAILITGAAGGIGSDAVKALVQEGYFVFACVRKVFDPLISSQIDFDLSPDQFFDL
jgi:hypothetical protein